MHSLTFEVTVIAIWDYQFILFPLGNVPSLSENVIEFVGLNKFSFYQAVDVLNKLANIKNDPTLKIVEIL